MTAWTQRPADHIAQAVRTGEVTAVAVAQAHLSAIAARNDTLCAFTDVTVERALAQAHRIDQAHARGDALPPLAGVPFAVKNLFDIAGVVTRAGSKINRDRPAATVDATAVARLEAAGAVLLGSLNMGEYAYDFTGQNAHDGNSKNPHDLSRISGAHRAAPEPPLQPGLRHLPWGPTPTARSGCRQACAAYLA